MAVDTAVRDARRSIISCLFDDFGHAFPGKEKNCNKTDVSRHHGSQIEDPSLKSPRTSQYCDIEGLKGASFESLLCRETPVSRTADVNFVLPGVEFV